MNRNFQCAPRTPKLTLNPTLVSWLIFLTHIRSTSIAALPIRTPRRNVLIFDSLREMNPPTPAFCGPTETSNFHACFSFALCIPVVIPPTGPTFHVKCPFEYFPNTLCAPTSRPIPRCVSEYVNVPDECSESARETDAVAAD